MTNSMNGSLISSSLPRPRPFLAIFVGGLAVGALDLVYAIAVYSPEKPILVPQFIASGVLGPAALSGGSQTAILGVALHFVIAFGAASIYYLASRKLTIMVRRAYLCGLIYGALVYGFMHMVVVPLSATPKGPTHLVYQSFEFIEHCLCVGLPIALSVRRYTR
jgi:hypothetical protein